MSIVNRFFEVIDKLEANPYQLSKTLVGVKDVQSKISQIKSGKVKNVSIDIISALCSSYPNASANYILTGIGNPVTVDNSNPSVISSDRINGSGKRLTAGGNVSDQSINLNIPGNNNIIKHDDKTSDGLASHSNEEWVPRAEYDKLESEKIQLCNRVSELSDLVDRLNRVIDKITL